MFEIGKRTPRKPLTPEQKKALNQVKQFCNEAKINRDDLARMFGLASWDSLTACRTVGRRAEAIASNIPKFKRLSVNTFL